MVTLKSLVNKLGVHFFKEYKGNKQSDLDIYGFLKKLCGKGIKLSSNDSSCEFGNKNILLKEENYLLNSDGNSISVSYIIKDMNMNMNDLSMSELVETDELNDSDDIVHVVIIKGEDKGKIVTSKFEIGNNGFSYKVNDMC